MAEAKALRWSQKVSGIITGFPVVLKVFFLSSGPVSPPPGSDRLGFSATGQAGRAASRPQCPPGQSHTGPAPPTSRRRGGWTHEPTGTEAETRLRRTQLSGLPASPQSLAMSCYIYQLPSWVLDDLCRNMDTLSEWDRMQFGEWSFLRPHLSLLTACLPWSVMSRASCCFLGPASLCLLRQALPLLCW